MMPHMGPQLVSRAAALWILSGRNMESLAANEAVSLGPLVLASASSHTISA